MNHRLAEQEPTVSDRESVEQRDRDDAMKSLDKALELLQAPDDTSRFVGLALLKSILDNHKHLREDGAIVTRCWTAIPVKFLDRLLKARPNEKKSKEEAQSMVALAVAIIHAFVTLLPSQMLKDAKLMGRIDGLVAAVPSRYFSSFLILLALWAGASGNFHYYVRNDTFSAATALSPWVPPLSYIATTTLSLVSREADLMRM